MKTEIFDAIVTSLPSFMLIHYGSFVYRTSRIFFNSLCIPLRVANS